MAQPRKNIVAAPALATNVPPLKLNVAVGLPPVWMLALALVTDVTDNVPPSRFTVPLLPLVLPAALRETSSLPQLIAPLSPNVNMPLPRLATYKTPLPPLMFIIPPLTVTTELPPAVLAP